MSQRTRDLVFPAAVGALLIATSLLPGCGGGSDASSGAAPTPSPPAATVPPAVMQAKEADTPVDPTTVTADNTFGLNLLNTLVAEISPGFYVNVAEHKTYVQVDESGTVAAAATGVRETSVVSLSVNLQVNHPFFYAIRDNQAGELLFVGVLMNPSAG
jgi:hypothetical protein